MKALIKSAVLVGGVCLSAACASAQTEIGTTTYMGNVYELWSASGISWAQAEANAIGQGGYLAALTGSADTAYIESTLIAPSALGAVGWYNEIWLGGSPAVPDGNGATTDPNNWAWVNGATWTTFDAGNFSPSEPNGDGYSHLAINLETPAGTFNDEGNSGLIGGYLVEKSVPDGGLTAAMLGLAFTGLGWMRRKS